MMNTRFLTVLRYELKILNPLLLLMPLFAALGLSGLGLWLAIRSTVSHDFIGPLLLSCLEACVPLTVGVIAASTAAHDSAIELQLTLPLPYRYTAFRRFLLVVVWTALVEFVAWLVLYAVLPWALPNPLVKGPLIWLPPLVWLAAVGALLALLLRNRAASGTVLGILWVVQLAFHGYFIANPWSQSWFLFATLYAPNASFWLSNRIELLVTALLVSLAVWCFLRNTEWRFRAEDV